MKTLNRPKTENVDYAFKQADRFSRSAVLLANAMVGVVDIRANLEQRRFLPVVIKDGDRMYCFFNSPTKNSDMDFLNPYIVNAAFALELYLKVLLYGQRNKWENSHELHGLFTKLSRQSQESIKSRFRATTSEVQYMTVRDTVRKDTALTDFDWDIDVLLANSSHAFVQWRYPFEGNLGWFAGFWELRQAIVYEIKSSRAANAIVEK
jgi:hypothetical protein